MCRVDEFTRQYIETALWASIGDDDMPLDREHSEHDLAPEALDAMKADCARFQAENSTVLEDLDDGHAGHNFWLTRNGHGAGFWDGDYQEPAATVLTDACKAFGECSLYKGDDEALHHFAG